MTPTLRAAAVLLVGGRSARMGRDKASLPFLGTSLLARAAQVLRDAASLLMVVRAPGQALPLDAPVAGSGVVVVDDPVAGEGPLVGLAAGLRALEGRAELAFAAAVDTPFLRPRLVRGVIDALAAAPEIDAVVPVLEGRDQPLLAAYRVTVADAAEAAIGAGERGLRDLLRRVRVRRLDEAALRRLDPELRCASNLNTPDDLAAAEVRAVEDADADPHRAGLDPVDRDPPDPEREHDA